MKEKTLKLSKYIAMILMAGSLAACSSKKDEEKKEGCEDCCKKFKSYEQAMSKELFDHEDPELDLMISLPEDDPVEDAVVAAGIFSVDSESAIDLEEEVQE